MGSPVFRAVTTVPMVGSGALLARWRWAWGESLRFRLLALGLMPLLMAFPIVVAVLVVVGGERANSLLASNLRSNVAGARNYLEQLKVEAGVRVVQLVKSERLVQLVSGKADHRELDRLLSSAAKGSGLDFLIVASQDGLVIGSSTGVPQGQRLPDSYVVRQAGIGVANAAYERVDAEFLPAFSPLFPAEARIEYRSEKGGKSVAKGLLINAAAHFPLAVNNVDAILVGGILLNKNASLIEHMREIIFPVGTLPGDAEGMTALFVDDVRIAISRQRQQGQLAIGTLAGEAVAAATLGRGDPWIGNLELGGQSYLMGYEPISDGDGRHIGMVAAGIPDGPYRRETWLLLGVIAGLLALTMLGLSLLFLSAGRELTQRLEKISTTMMTVRSGDRGVRVGVPLREDEVGRLTHHFDELLDTIATQDAQQRAAQQTIADEASRRRSLFEHERDGVVILNPDGSVFEANPKAAAMLGYVPEELARLRLCDWDARLGCDEVGRLLAEVGGEGHFFETLHRRKDGTTYVAEVSVSRADWGERTFVLLLQRDISERKAVEAELATYRRDLESLVEQRTKELNDRSGQLNAIFTLSPDGFVSFDSDGRVSFANAAFLRMAGVEPADILGLDETAFSNLLAGRSLANAVFPGVAALRIARRKVDEEGAAVEGKGARRQLFELAGPGNRVLEVGIRLSETGNVSQILYFRDVTHETEVDRMKSEFLSTAAHELRTPMASIYGFSQLLLIKQFSEEKRREVLGTVVRQSELMSSIINELLDLARIEARRGKDFVIERLSLQAVVAETVAGYKLPAERQAPAVAVAGEELFVNADRKKMQQTLLNVLSNAYKYSPAGGAVDIAYRRDEETGRVGMTISDRGIGMTPEQLARVFERFFRADTSGNIPGTGLGMSVVKEIVELHGGEVQVESTIGVGTAVTIWLPAA